MFIFADPAATEHAVGPKRFNPIPAFGTPNTVLTSFKSNQLYVKQKVHGWNSFYNKDPSLESPLQEAKLSYHLVPAFSCELRESPANMMDLNKVLHGKSWSGLDIFFPWLSCKQVPIYTASEVPRLRWHGTDT